LSNRPCNSATSPEFTRNRRQACVVPQKTAAHILVRSQCIRNHHQLADLTDDHTHADPTDDHTLADTAEGHKPADTTGDHKPRDTTEEHTPADITKEQKHDDTTEDHKPPDTMSTGCTGCPELIEVFRIMGTTRCKGECRACIDDMITRSNSAVKQFMEVSVWPKLAVITKACNLVWSAEYCSSNIAESMNPSEASNFGSQSNSS
jgi:hypothetical protein